MEIAPDCLHKDVSAASLDHRVALHVLDANRLPAGGGAQLTSDGTDAHSPTTGANAQIGIHGADCNTTASGAHSDVAIDVVEVYSSTARFGIDAAIQVRELQVAAIGFRFDDFHVAWSGNDALHRTAMPVTRAFAAEICCLGLTVRDDAQVVKGAAGALF